MEKLSENATAINTKLVRVTPDQLRQLANRMELAAREACLPGELVLLDFTKTIALVYDPELHWNQWRGPALESTKESAENWQVQ